jgi:Competence protein CoiA-like family
MPLTCNLTRPSSFSQRFDATDAQDSEWQRIYRVRPRPLLTCPECRSRVHAKVSRRGLRFFAHDQAQRGCSLGGETQAHLHLKRLLAQIIRSTPNWSVAIEAGPMEGDTGGWRADVLATGVEGRRMAFEVQLAAMTVADGIERAGVYERDHVEQVWLAPSNPSWALSIPTLAVSGAKPLAETQPEDLRVVRGLYRRNSGGSLEPRGGSPLLPMVVTGPLTGSYRIHELRAQGRTVCAFVHTDDAPEGVTAPSWVNRFRPSAHSAISSELSAFELFVARELFSVRDIPHYTNATGNFKYEVIEALERYAAARCRRSSRVSTARPIV